MTDIFTGIKLVCFDLDDTLWPCMPTIQFAEAQIYQWLADHKPIITQNYSPGELRDKRKSLYQRRPDLVHDLSALRRISLMELADEFGFEYDWVEDAFQVFYHARQQVKFFDDVELALCSLGDKYLLASVTNGNADIRTTSLGHHFDYVLSAAVVGKPKPHPAMFQHLMQLSEYSAGQILHIGDHEEHDIGGGIAAGVKTVWLNRAGVEWQSKRFQPDREISSLYELIQLAEAG